MILETTQLLNNALCLNSHSVSYLPIYRTTHLKHPCTLWAAHGRQNFQWLLNLGLALSEEYTYRYGKRHGCHTHLDTFVKNRYVGSMPNNDLTPFVKCMPAHFKVEDPIQSYRNYYRNAKEFLASWRLRTPPSWWDGTPIIKQPRPKAKPVSTSLKKYAEGWERIFGRKEVIIPHDKKAALLLPTIPVRTTYYRDVDTSFGTIIHQRWRWLDV